ncbi:MAG: DUF1223 domain-containing protein [Mucilaginibacter sp.]
MKKINIAFTLVLLLPALIAFAIVKPKTKAIATIDDITGGFAVVELFTSEGCSSCPSADAVIAKIEKEMADKPVYILAYHVDYWNRLGWKDVFSSADYSRRQSTYAGWLNLRSVYTPQVIVNGKTEFVGSRESALRSAIQKGLEKNSKASIAINRINTDGNRLKFSYVTNTIAGNNLLVALIKKTAVSAVKQGENNGRILHHVQIVNSLQNILLTNKNGEGNITLPTGFLAPEYEVIAFVQRANTGEIIAATRGVIN